ncbi:MAG: hypothetical protein GC160_15425 [Acidobacteria bacterium]|nr:hypothetical protein [Acidobacteriota bacterium]
MNRKRQVVKCLSLARTALALCAATLTLSGAVYGQTSDAVEVVVPVTVTDGSGRAVAGLAPEMFRAEVDGERAEMVSVRSSHEFAATIVFAPSVVKRWHEIREGAADAVRNSGGRAVIVFSRDESAVDGAWIEGVRFAGTKDRYRWPGDELAGMIALGLESMQSIPVRPGLRRAVFVVLEFPPEDLRHYRKSLLEQAASDDVQVFALWRSRQRYAENEGRSMLLLEQLVERTGGRAARFSEPARIPGMIAQFASALRAAYEVRVRVSPNPAERRIDVEVSLPKEDPRVLTSFRTRARVEAE